jgi:hypothetical protein
MEIDTPGIEDSPRQGMREINRFTALFTQGAKHAEELFELSAETSV